MIWPTLPLGSVSTLLSGGTPAKSDHAMWNGDIPWVSPKDMGQWLLDDAQDHVSPRAIGNGTRLAGAGASLIVVRSMGLLSGVQLAYARRDVAFNQDLKAVVAKPGIDQRFLFYAVAAARPRIHEQVDEASHGTKRIQTYVLETLPIPVPPIGSQIAIASVLGALDDKIDLNCRTNKTIDDLTVKAYERVVANRYQLKQMADICEPLRDTVDPARQPGSTFSLYSFQAFDNGGLPLDVSGSSIKSLKLTVQEGTVLVAKLNPHIARVWLADPAVEAPAIASTEWLVLKPKAPGTPALLYTLCRSSDFALDLASLVTGSTGSHQRVAGESVMNMQIRWPDFGTDPELDGVIRPMLELKRHNLHENGSLVKLRDALLPELISGRMTVN